MAGKLKPLSDIQKKRLDDFNSRWSEYKRLEIEAFQIAKMQAAAQVSVAKVHAAEAARDAFASGVSMRRMGLDVMRTSDYNTVRGLLSLAEPLTAVQEATAKEDAELKIEHIEGSLYRVTLAGSELERAKIRAGFEGMLPPRYATAVLSLIQGAFVSTADNWLADLQIEHPVIAWLSVPSNQIKLQDLHKETI